MAHIGSQENSSTGAAQNFIASLRASLGNAMSGKSGSDMFASLLSQVKASEAAQPEDKTTTAAVKSDDDSSAQDDKEQLQKLLNRIKDDAETLRAHHAARHGKKAAAQKDGVAVKQAQGKHEEKKCASAKKTDQTQQASEESETTDTDETQSAATTTDETAAEQTALNKDDKSPSDDAAPVVVADDATKTDTTDQALREDMAQAEVAAMLLLRQMLAQVKPVQAKATETVKADAANIDEDAVAPVIDPAQTEAAAAAVDATKSDAAQKKCATPVLPKHKDVAQSDLPVSDDASDNSIDILARNKAFAVDRDTRNEAADERHDAFVAMLKDGAAVPVAAPAATTAQTNTQQTTPASNLLAAINSATSGAENSSAKNSLSMDMGAETEGGASSAAAQTDNGMRGTPVAADGVGKAGTYDFAAQLSSVRSRPGVNAPAIVQQVSFQLNRGAANGEDSISIQLHPADLGRVDVKLEVGADKKVHGTVTADSQATLDLLSKDVKSLERALQDAGLRADSGCLSFNLRGNNGGSAQDQGRANANANLKDDIDVAAVDAPAEETYYVTPGRVNVKI